MSEYISLNDTVYFTANFYHPVSGFSYVADETPVWYVYESGATPILNGTMTVRDDIVGSYWGNFVASDGNGFVSARYYDVQVSGMVNGVSGFAKVKDFVVGDIYDVNVVQVSGEYVSQDSVFDANLIQVSGVPISLTESIDANVIQIKGDADFDVNDAVSVSGIVQADVVQVSGEYVHLNDFGGGTGGASAADVWAHADRSLTEAVSVSGIVQADVVQVSGDYVHITDFNTDISNLPTITQLYTRTLPSGEYASSTDVQTIVELINTLPDAVGIRIFNDTEYDTNGYELVTGNLISGTSSDTSTIGTYLVFAPDGSNVLDVNFEFALGTSKPSFLVFKGRYSGTGGPASSRYAIVYIYDYNIDAWVALSNGSNHIADGTTDSEYDYILAPNFQNPADGVVKIRYVSNRTNSADRLHIDLHAVEAVSVGATLGDVAEAVWSKNIRNRQLDGTHNSAGYFLARSCTDWGNVLEVVDNQVTMSGAYFLFDENLYNDRILQFHKNGEQVYEVARITDQYANGVLVLDRVPVLVESSGWHGYILPQLGDQTIKGLTDYGALTVDDLGYLDQDIYFAQIKYISDVTNDADEFAVHWFKNDQPVSSGELTGPCISVYNTATGEAKLEHQSMNYASSMLGVVRHNQSPMVLASGEPYLIETSGTIDSVVRTWRSIVGIDLL